MEQEKVSGKGEKEEKVSDLFTGKGVRFYFPHTESSN